MKTRNGANGCGTIGFAVCGFVPRSKKTTHSRQSRRREEPGLVFLTADELSQLLDLVSRYDKMSIQKCQPCQCKTLRAIDVTRAAIDLCKTEDRS